MAVGWTLGTASLGVGACTFPDFAVRSGAGGVASTAGGSTGGSTTGSGGSGGASNAGSLNQAGASSGNANAGEAGTTSVAEPLETDTWSAAALDRFGFSLLGSATLAADGVTITRADTKGETGGVVQRQELDLALAPELHVAVDFRIQPGKIDGDGLAVMLHASPKGYKALGSGGGGMGYGGLEPCVAVEVDTAEVAATDYPAPHLGLMLGCVPERQGPTRLDLGGDPGDGKDWRLRIDWYGKTNTMNITLVNVATGRETHLDEPVDLTMLLGTKAFVAVTAATGEFTATQAVKSLLVSGGGLSPRQLTSAAAAP